MRHADDPWLATLRPAGKQPLTPEDFAARFLHEGEATDELGVSFDDGDPFDEAGPPEFQARSLLRCCALLQARFRVGASAEGAPPPRGQETSSLLQAPPTVTATHAPLPPPPRQQQQRGSGVCGTAPLSLPELADPWQSPGGDVFRQPLPGGLSAHATSDSALLSLAEDGRARQSLSVLCVSDVQAAAQPLVPRCLTVCLRHCSSLASLALVRCPFLGDTACWRHLTAGLAQCNRLTALAVCDCHLVGDSCLQPLATCLLELSRRSGGGLVHLSLAANRGLGDSSIGTLAEALVHCTSLASLRLPRCGLGHAACHSLSAVLGHPGCGLTHLDVGFNPDVGTPGAALLADVLAVNTSLRCLSLPGCSLDAAAARPLARGLRANWTGSSSIGVGRVSHLDVSSNALAHGMGSPAMCDALADAGPGLQVLDISRNGVDAAAMGRLMAALRRGMRAQRGEALVLRCGGNPGAGAALEGVMAGGGAGRELRVEAGH